MDSVSEKTLGGNDVGALRECYPSVTDYIQLMKPRVMALVIFTAIVGIVLSPGDVHPLIAFSAIVFITVGAGASGALNMWWDHDIDAVMSRTKKRSLPSGRMTRDQVLLFGASLSFISVSFLFLFTNAIAASLLLFTIAFYLIIYTILLKRRTYLNVVIGGVAGALPPVIAWHSTSTDFAIEPLILFMIIFLWTPPHSWALALFKREDYIKAEIPMLPVISGERATRLQILVYSLLLVAFSFAPFFSGMAGIPYLAVALILGINFLRHSWKLWKKDDKNNNYALEKALFKFSISYLFLIFGTLLISGLVDFEHYLKNFKGFISGQ